MGGGGSSSCYNESSQVHLKAFPNELYQWVTFKKDMHCSAQGHVFFLLKYVSVQMAESFVLSIDCFHSELRNQMRSTQVGWKQPKVTFIHFMYGYPRSKYYTHLWVQ